MNKELIPLEALKKLLDGCISFDNLSQRPYLIKDSVEYRIIENALERLEQQDKIIAILKGIIEFGTKLPDIKINDDGSFQGIIGAVGMRIQRNMENQERELLRKWVLKNCFPKELKALEVIKELFKIRIGIDESENDKSCGMVFLVADKDHIWEIYHTFDEENIQKLKLLKEVLK